MIKKLDHFVITTANMQNCIKFYKMLGFHSVDAGGHWELFASDFKINVHYLDHELEPKAKHVQIGSVDLCLELECSLSQCEKVLMEHKVTIEQNRILRHGVNGVMHSLYVRDPDGNLIELCSYE